MEIYDLNVLNKFNVFVNCSLTQLGEGSNNSRVVFLRMSEWWRQNTTPRKLSVKSGDFRVLNQILWCDISDFLLSVNVLGGRWNVFHGFTVRHLSNITNIVHGFNLGKMHFVVLGPKQLIINNCNIKRLESFRSSSGLIDC